MRRCERSTRPAAPRSHSAPHPRRPPTPRAAVRDNGVLTARKHSDCETRPARKPGTQVRCRPELDSRPAHQGQQHRVPARCLEVSFGPDLRHFRDHARCLVRPPARDREGPDCRAQPRSQLACRSHRSQVLARPIRRELGSRHAAALRSRVEARGRCAKPAACTGRTAAGARPAVAPCAATFAWRDAYIAARPKVNQPGIPSHSSPARCSKPSRRRSASRSCFNPACGLHSPRSPAHSALPCRSREPLSLEFPFWPRSS